MWDDEKHIHKQQDLESDFKRSRIHVKRLQKIYINFILNTIFHTFSFV